MSIERVDPQLCNGCGVCINSCPQDVIRLDTIVKKKGEYSACRSACPAGVDMRRYFYLLKNDMLEEAIEVLREVLPLPAVTGRVCHHPCESQCSRKAVDEAVNINALERYTADYWLREKAQSARKIYNAQVAIIGSGPAGLSCAYFLTRMGYPVTVFEALPVLGGMLRVGIPEYRLPKSVLENQINYIRNLGVEFKTGVTIGKDITIDDLQKDYQALFYATGKPLSRKVEIEGIGLKGVFGGLDFLRDSNLKRKIKVKDKVLVIGGGNVAMDVALTSLRSGAKEVHLACLESGEQMPAFKDEIQQAIEEGIHIQEGWGPQKILGRGERVNGVELVRCLSVFDKNGKFDPSYDSQLTKTIQVDMVILAIGQDIDLALVPQGMKVTPDGTLQVDPITLETTLTGIFAGGDAIAGTASVVEAISNGKKASISIDRYLKGEDMNAGRYLQPPQVKKPPKEGIEKLSRLSSPLLPLDQRQSNFKEIKLSFNGDMARLEVQRCMTCGSQAVINYVDDCQLCLYCERDCPQKAIFVSSEKKEDPLLAWG